MMGAMLLWLGIPLAAAMMIPPYRGRGPADPWQKHRAAMVDKIRAHGVRNAAVLDAMLTVPRHLFIPERFRHGPEHAYGDHPCGIGWQQTVSQPFIVAHMTEQLTPVAGERILEIGTGSGYQAAILAALGAQVFSVERIPALAEHARGVFASLDIGHVHVRTGDGYAGWHEHAPYDAVIVTCGPERVPDALTQQLRDGGRIIIPVGDQLQRLVLLRKTGDRLEEQVGIHVRFVPMVEGCEDIETS
jgi:protein-L-isoaspartate(D-aspartate) O-methyltransferase